MDSFYMAKLRGGFVLVHMHRARTRPREKSRWLLINRKDEYAGRSWDPEDEAVSRSVLTRRTLEEIQHGLGARKSGRLKIRYIDVLLSLLPKVEREPSPPAVRHPR